MAKLQRDIEEFYRREHWHDGGAMATRHPAPCLAHYHRPYPGFATPKKPITWVGFDEWPKIVGKVPQLTSDQMAEWVAHRFHGGTKQAFIDCPTYAEAVEWAKRRVEVDGSGYGVRGSYEHFLMPKRGGYYVGLFLVPEDATPTLNRYGEEVYEAYLAGASLLTFELIARMSRLADHPREHILNYLPFREHPPDGFPGVLYWLDWARRNAGITHHHALVWQAVNRAASWSKLCDPRDLDRFAALAVCLTRAGRCPVDWGSRVEYKLDSWAHRLFHDIAERCGLAVPEWLARDWAPHPGNALMDPWHDPEEIHAVPHYGASQRRITLYQYSVQEEWYASGTHRARMWGGDTCLVVQPPEEDVRTIIATAFASEPGPSVEIEPWKSWRAAWLAKREAEAERDRVLAAAKHRPDPDDDDEPETPAEVRPPTAKRRVVKVAEGQMALFPSETSS